MKKYLGKIDYLGTGRKINKCYIEWEIDDNNIFAAWADVWNRKETDIVLSGQCIDDVAKIFPNNKQVQSIKTIWEKYHLQSINNMPVEIVNEIKSWSI